MSDATDQSKADPHDAWFRAACVGDVERLKGMVGLLHFDDKDEEGYTALMLAAQAFKPHAIAYLLGLGASPFTEAANGYNALLCASGDVEALRAFAAAGVNLNHANKNRVTPLLLAASLGFTEAAAFLLQAGVDTTLKDRNNMTALDRAKRAGQRGIVALLQASAEPRPVKPAAKPKEKTMSTANQLLKAVRAGNVELIQELLAQGAPLECQNRDGYTPLMVAAEHGRQEAFDVLLQAGANPLARSGTDNDALYLACVGGHLEMVKALLARGAEINFSSAGTGYTALMGATLSGKLEVVQFLVEAGADVHAKTPFSNETALKWAREQKHKAIVAYLKEQMGPAPAKPPAPPAVPVTAADPSKPMQVLRAAVQNFAVTASEPAFQGVLKKLEALTGKPPTASTKRPGVFMLALGFKTLTALADHYSLPKPSRDPEDRDSSERILGKLRDEVRQAGFLLMVDSLWESGEAIKMRLFPTADPYAVMASCGTNANNYGHSNKAVIAWLRELEQTHPFTLTACGHDFVAGRFTNPVTDAKPLAKRMLDFCPDLSDGTATAAQIAKDLTDNQTFFFWWD